MAPPRCVTAPVSVGTGVLAGQRPLGGALRPLPWLGRRFPELCPLSPAASSPAGSAASSRACPLQAGAGG